MVHGRQRFVAAPVAGIDQAPHHVDVLASAQRFVEPTDRPQHLRSHDQRRAGHVADAGSGRYSCRLVTEVQR